MFDFPMEGANTVIFLTSGDKSDKIRLKKSYLERPWVDENRIFFSGFSDWYSLGSLRRVCQGVQGVSSL